MKKLVIGILAHVDAGKTTLSESLLYQSGAIRKMGRVDNGDAFLDTFELEKNRGITIFSKQAVLDLENTHITLLDTPGHVDFSAEMERALQVMDYAILVISGADGVQGHTLTLWRLLKKYKIPVFLFINKMDQSGTDKEAILSELYNKLDTGCIDFTSGNLYSDIFYENVAMSNETLLERYLESYNIENDVILNLISSRKIFPCYFGSALKMQGLEEFVQGIDHFTTQKHYPNEFGAKVYKITRDEQGNRLTFMKITGGNLKVRTVLTDQEEKINQIRIYSGSRFTAVNEIEAGCICAVTGLSKTYPGQGLGVETASFLPILEPVLTYQIILPSGCDSSVFLPKLRQLEEEEPLLHIVWNEHLQEIQVQVMGEVQIEILKSLILERFGISVEFGSGSILYKETITDVVEGVGHFEPLRHYAEVHLLLEPGERGSGLQYAINCSEDLLDKNWQKQIITHLEEKDHRGVLTGASITDIKITLVSGKAHQKHTEGGDFRQATYRALRQGLKQAHSILLEPYYEFRLEIPENMVGRAMSDIEKMHGTFEILQTINGNTILTGEAPVINMRDYQQEVIAYTRGFGHFFCSLKGYEPVVNMQEIIDLAQYDSERDLDNPTGSVFCANGTGFVVAWDNVKSYMHLPSVLVLKQENTTINEYRQNRTPVQEDWIDDEEVEAILSQAHFANKRDKSSLRKGVVRRSYQNSVQHTPNTLTTKKIEPKERYLLVDGYNIIYAWTDLKELAEISLDGARGKLLDILSNYQGIIKSTIIAVFDAYKVKNHETNILDYHNIQVVFTKEDETADQYIEKYAYENSQKYDITVATSDGLEQIIIRGKDCKILSARELKEEIQLANERVQERFKNLQPKMKNYLFESVSEDITKQINDSFEDQ